MVGTGEQKRNGSPVKPTLQMQEGKWFMTWHSAFCPQVPEQGFWHRLFMQACVDGHSLLCMHSGRHPS